MDAQKFPEDRRSYYDTVDKNDLYRMPYSGLFQTEMRTNENREYLVYIPSNAYLSTPAVLIICDSQDEKQRCLEESGWIEAADRYGVIIFAVDGSCSEEELTEMIEEMKARDCHVVNRNYVYLMGYGDGASKAQRLAMKNPVAFSGLALAGDCDVTDEELEAMDRIPSEHPFKPISSVPMPLWIMTERLTQGQKRILEYWKKADRVQPVPYEKEGSSYYLPLETTVDSLIEELVGAKIRVTEGMSTSPYPEIPPVQIWDEFFSEQFRAVGITNGNLRVWRRDEEWGIQLKSIDIDGYRREWYEYIPSVMRQNPDYKAPLVVSLHGGSNMHRMFLPTNEWIKVAEARGFMVIFPAAALRPFRKDNWLRHAAWNSGNHQDMMDDVTFIKELLEHLFEEYNIDRSRVYASGQSMGSAMGQRLLLTLPDYFAASGTTSGVLRGGFFGDYSTPGIVEGYKRPIWIIMGERDIGGGDFDNNPDAKKYAEYWTKRNETQQVDQPAYYKTGAYYTKIYHNGQGVPMVQFTTVDLKPHACTAQDSWFLYDEFFSKFHINENGKTVYLNTITVE